MREQNGKITALVPHLNVGGAMLSMVRIANELVQMGYAVDLLVATGSDGALKQRTHPDVKVVELRCRRPLLAIRALSRYLAQEQPAVLMSTPVATSVVALLATRLLRRRPRVVVREAGCLVTEKRFARQQPWSTYRFVLWLVPYLYPAADAVIAISDAVAEDLWKLTRVPRERTHVIFNPAYEPKAHYATPTHPWFIDGGPPVVVSAGRLVRWKGFDTLLDAMAVLRGEREVRLVILGDGPERDNLQQQAEALGLREHVHFAGFVENLADYMAAGAVFVLASRSEGFGNVLVEALGTGTPVVSTDCPGGPRAILADGKYGRLTPVDDAPALAQAILATLHEPGDREARVQRAHDFRADRIAREYLGVLLPQAAAASP